MSNMIVFRDYIGCIMSEQHLAFKVRHVPPQTPGDTPGEQLCDVEY